MRRLVLPLFALVFLVAAAPAFADNGHGSSNGCRQVTYSGTIGAVSAGSLTVIGEKGKQVVVSVPAGTTVRRADKNVALASLAVGDHVVVPATLCGAQVSARRVLDQPVGARGGTLSPGASCIDTKAVFSGIISAVSDNQIVLNRGGHPASITVTADTIFSQNDVTVSAAEIAVGDRGAVVTGCSQAGAGAQYIALVVIDLGKTSAGGDHGAPGGGDHSGGSCSEGKQAFSGVLGAVTNGQLTVTGEHGHAITVTVTAGTIFRSHDQTVTADVVVAGDHGGVITGCTPDASGQYTALVVIDGGNGDHGSNGDHSGNGDHGSNGDHGAPGSGDHSGICSAAGKVDFEGVISALTDSSITISGEHGQTTITIDAHTVFRSHDQTISAAEIKVGDRGTVIASGCEHDPAGTPHTALTVIDLGTGENAQPPAPEPTPGEQPPTSGDQPPASSDGGSNSDGK